MRQHKFEQCSRGECLDITGITSNFNKKDLEKFVLRILKNVRELSSLTFLVFLMRLESRLIKIKSLCATDWVKLIKS